MTMISKEEAVSRTLWILKHPIFISVMTVSATIVIILLASLFIFMCIKVFVLGIDPIKAFTEPLTFKYKEDFSNIRRGVLNNPENAKQLIDILFRYDNGNLVAKNIALKRLPGVETTKIMIQEYGLKLDLLKHLVFDDALLIKEYIHLEKECKKYTNAINNKICSTISIPLNAPTPITSKIPKNNKKVSLPFIITKEILRVRHRETVATSIQLYKVLGNFGKSSEDRGCEQMSSIQFAIKTNQKHCNVQPMTISLHILQEHHNNKQLSPPTVSPKKERSLFIGLGYGPKYILDKECSLIINQRFIAPHFSKDDNKLCYMPHHENYSAIDCWNIPHARHCASNIDKIPVNSNETTPLTPRQFQVHSLNDNDNAFITEPYAYNFKNIRCNVLTCFNNNANIDSHIIHDLLTQQNTTQISTALSKTSNDGYTLLITPTACYKDSPISHLLGTEIDNNNLLYNQSCISAIQHLASIMLPMCHTLTNRNIRDNSGIEHTTNPVHVMELTISYLNHVLCSIVGCKIEAVKGEHILNSNIPSQEEIQKIDSYTKTLSVATTPFFNIAQDMSQITSINTKNVINSTCTQSNIQKSSTQQTP